MEERSCGIIPIRYKKTQPEFLLIQHHAGHWGFPKGHQEAGENELATARRELFEETGVKLKKVFPERFVERYQYQRAGKKRKKSVVYFAALVKPGLVKIQKEEIKSYAWLSYRRAIQRIPYEEMKKILRAVKNTVVKIPTKEVGKREGTV
jgi:8-oxo-dGTP pyrophosphatase MutT (NUDIX family)